MAYKRYFYRKGKKFGPYYYESYRDEKGKVKKRYVGRENPEKSVKNIAPGNNLEENIAKKDYNRVTPTSFNLGILVLLLVILVLIDALFILFYVRN